MEDEASFLAACYKDIGLEENLAVDNNDTEFVVGFIDSCSEVNNKKKQKNKKKARGGRISGENYKKKQLSYEHVSEQLEKFSACCKRLCFSWLTVQILMYCRNAYVGLLTQEDRRS